MRRPSPNPYWSQWHEDKVRGLAVPVYENEPQAGFYKKRKAARSPEFYPAAIWWAGEVDPETGELTGDETLRCHIAGFEYDPYKQWLWLAKRPIDLWEYDALMRALQEPQDPWLAHSERPGPSPNTDHLKTPVPF